MAIVAPRLFFLGLAIIPFEQSTKRQVLIQVRPVQTERRNLDVVQLSGRAAREPEIFRNRKTNLRAAFHADDDEPVFFKNCWHGVIKILQPVQHVNQLPHAAVVAAVEVEADAR